MPYLTRREIEGIANRILRAYFRLPSLRNTLLERVYPRVMAEELLGLTVEYHRLSVDGSILGLTAYEDVGIRIYDNLQHPEHYFLDGKTILLEKNLISEKANKGRHAFTMMHETSHQIWGMLYPWEYKRNTLKPRVHYCRQRTMSASDWDEWRTNTLAAALLMPTEMVWRNMRRFGLSEPIKLLNKKFAPSEFSSFCEIAEFMGVSQQALSIRMKQLGLLKTSQLENPYEMVDIFPEKEEIYA